MRLQGTKLLSEVFTSGAGLSQDVADRGSTRALYVRHGTSVWEAVLSPSSTFLETMPDIYFSGSRDRLGQNLGSLQGT